MQAYNMKVFVVDMERLHGMILGFFVQSKEIVFVLIHINGSDQNGGKDLFGTDFTRI
ncbi:MAG TPA: hypothetical protein PKL06_09805 [Chitinophagales bacterium]|nr:hypothetical protein [Chitinophagales bacterium]